MSSNDVVDDVVGDVDDDDVGDGSIASDDGSIVSDDGSIASDDGSIVSDDGIESFAQAKKTFAQKAKITRVLGRIDEVKKELRRSKIMIVGEGCAGKTAFSNSIIGKEYEETESTVGINTFMCSVTHAALSESEWKKCDKIEKEYENAIAEHLSKNVDNDDLEQNSRQIAGADKNDRETRIANNLARTQVDEDLIVKYLANHVEIGANILISIFDYGGQTVFNVSTIFIYHNYSVY
jgi:GTPase SAR1 family protein